MRVPSTEVQNNFGKYLKIASDEEEVVITRKGQAIARIVPCVEEHAVREEAPNYSIDSVGRMSYEEFLEMTEKSEMRYEFIDGEVFLLSSPTYFHQTALAEIYVTFYNWFKGKPCKPMMAPFDVTLVKRAGGINVVQPDILVICDRENINEKGRYKGVPTLVVEVISGSNRRHDMIRKLDLYTMTGIKEYWLVDPDKKGIYVYTFEEEDIKGYEFHVGSKAVESIVFPGLRVELAEVFS